jgi:phosphoglycolate phosphatase (TIGR01487 family)
MNYKLLATDIDGTITDEHGRLDLQAAEAIRNLESRGVTVVLVSGRPLPFVESLALYLGTSGPVIAENGAVVKNKNHILLLGDPQPAKNALSLLQEEFPVELDDDNRYRLVDITFKKSIDPRLIQRFIKERQLPVTLLVTNVMLHLVDYKVSKGRTILEVLKNRGVDPREIAVCGDSYNDLPMFEIGAMNLAVANTEEPLKQKADYISQMPYGEGFAELVARILI